MDFPDLDKTAEALKKAAEGVALAAKRDTRVTASLLLTIAVLILLLVPVHAEWGWKPAAGMLSAAILIFVFVVLRMQRSIAVDRTKLRGGAPYGDYDGDLFSGLRREDAMEKLGNHVASGEAAVVFVWGPWGVGKTSLVKAGLRKALNDERLKDIKIKILYGNARRPGFEKTLVDENRRDGEFEPASLGEIIQLESDEVRVIIIDNADLVSHESLKGWAELALTQQGRYRRVLVFVVDDEDFQQNWSLETWSNPDAVQQIPLNRFHRDSAERVAQALADKANLRISNGLIADMVDDLASGPSAEVFPLALSVLLYLVGNRERFNSKAYRDSGYAPGLLKEYILDHLIKSAPEHSEDILAALARQGDHSFLAKDLGAIPIDPPRLSALLAHLSSSEVHILHSSCDRSTFKMLDDWVPTLKSLGEAPIESRVLRRYGFWSAEGPFRGLGKHLGEGRFLLSRNELKQIEGKAVQFGGRQDLQEYISRSRTYRKVQTAGSVVLTLGVVIASVFTYLVWRKHEVSAIETAWGLPGDFAKYGNQLTDLSVVCSVNDLRLLPRKLTWLDANCNMITSLRGAPPRLDHLELTFSSVASLRYLPASVTDLNIHGAKILKIDELHGVGLSTLDASGVQVTNLNLIPRSVTRLKLQHEGITNLEGLPRKLITLVLLGTRVPSLKALPNTIENLTLLQSSGMAIDVLPPNLKYLETNNYPVGLTVPETLVLSTTRARVPEGVVNLELKKSASIGPLPKSLKSLKFHDEPSVLPLEKIPQTLERLKIIWPERIGFDLLPKHLVELDLGRSQWLSSLKGATIGQVTELDISSTGIANLEEVPNSVTTLHFQYCLAKKLAKFPERLAKLYLGGCFNLTAIDKLPETLTDLHLEDTPIASLPKLPKSLLRLDISNTNIRGHLPTLPSKLDELVLDVGQVTTLEGLPRSVKKLRFRSHIDK